MVRTRWTIRDVESLPDSLEDKRYEIIDGELYVSTQPHYYHQLTCTRILVPLTLWDQETAAGSAVGAPGVIFAVDEAVAPDVIWVSAQRLSSVLGTDGKLHAAPDLVVEVLSPGQANEQRDREAKLLLYSRRGVREYWIVDWRLRRIEVYRRENAALHLVATLEQDDIVSSPLLPGFGLSLGDLFAGFPESIAGSESSS